jgi:hypothetical protein
MDSAANRKTINKKPKLPIRQTFVYPAGIGRKLKFFYFWFEDLFVTSNAKKKNDTAKQ